MLSKIFFLFVIIFACFLGSYAAATSYTFNAVGDTYTPGDSHLNDNNGTNTFLRLKHPSAGFSNVLVKFSQDEIVSTLGSSHIVSAYLELYVETNNNIWGSGSYVDAYRMSNDWDEMGATWNCPSDSNVSNTSPDCDDLWNGGYYEDAFSDTLFFQNGDLSWKNYDVTSDVQLIQNGYDSYGWLVRKRDYNSQGLVDFTSVQGTTTQRPKLVVTVDDQNCAPANVDTVSPLVIPADGNSWVVTVNGQNLNHVTQIYVDGTPTVFTNVDTSTLTIAVSYTTVADHQISFKADCLVEPIYSFTITTIPASVGNFPQANICSAAPGATKVTRSGIVLRWKGAGKRFAAYSTFDVATRNDLHPSESNVCHTSPPGSNDSWNICDYFTTLQYYTGDPHGVNMTRILASGLSNASYQSGGVAGAKMPFVNNGTVTNPNYDVATLGCGSATCNHAIEGGTRLDCGYVGRLIAILTDALNRGVIVQLTLFDGVTLSNFYSTTNPWNPLSNNMDANSCTLLDNKSSATPTFYNICSDSSNPCTSLNCLGKIEQNYVDQIINLVATGNNGGSFKNVFFEIMNEAPLLARSADSSSLTQYKMWHNTVASWIKASNTNYVVTASVGPGDPAALSACNTNPCNSYSFTSGYAHCSQSPTTSQCANPFEVFHLTRLASVGLHGGTWCGLTSTCNANKSPCTTAVTAKNDFSKPVITSDDGDGLANLRQQHSTVNNWAMSSMYCRGAGVVSYDHIEGAQMNNNPSTCTNYADTCLHCSSLQALGAAGPNGFGPTCLNGLCGILPSETNYCGNSYPRN
ncbi:MAG: hypothetical protein C5B54_12150 [Acidobacteria bacterium]|nr:MAG: hypothetical protein C5B54_12150 [Acidobacteriota bacterium]